ncbi:MAG TPA: polysaccharide lyase family protein, partial [Candidatus Methylacidiphilales bacterium]|nr:polysaccharide lyase family protein [Candidatus Methylacidiphilales bacterium]
GDYLANGNNVHINQAGALTTSFGSEGATLAVAIAPGSEWYWCNGADSWENTDNKAFSLNPANGQSVLCLNVSSISSGASMAIGAFFFNGTSNVNTGPLGTGQVLGEGLGGITISQPGTYYLDMPSAAAAAGITNVTGWKGDFWFSGSVGQSITMSSVIAQPPSSTTVWRIGLKDGSNAEFTGTPGSSMPSTYTIPSNWATQTMWPQWPPAPPSNTPWTTTINYNLAAVPQNGLMFTFKAVNASMMIPELAVYSNFAPCGIIQIAGAQYPGFGSPDTYTRQFTRPYQVYIPPQFLVAGANQLQISALGSPYNRSTTIFLGFTIDYMELDTQPTLPSEPMNGKITYTGINDGGFTINSSTVAIDQAEAEWMGVAYCGNPERIPFWNNLTNMQTPASQLSQLQEMQALNMTCIMDGWNCANTTNSMVTNGILPPDGSTNYISNLFSSYGSYFQFYEICNEPCQSITNASNKYSAAVAAYINDIKPPTVVLASPGYAYGGGYGSPTNWDNMAGYTNRTALDSLCGAYNGHAYGSSYGYDNGSLAETVDADGTWVGGNPQVTNGWAKPFIVTECGSGTNSADAHEVCTSTNEEYSSSLDRDLRAHIAFADYFCAHAMFNNGAQFDYINGTQTNTSTWVANPANATFGDNDTRPKALRRLALAYGTHGMPLRYTWQSPPTSLPGIAQGPVYFRAVDTSTLPPLPGSGATSSKILLSFVNFDLLNANTISVNVTMPASKTYTGVSYNSATSYSSARSVITGLTANPVLPLTVSLGPGESVEYILNK